MDKEQWKTSCQTFEANFHAGSNYRWDKEAFESAWAKHFGVWCKNDSTDVLSLSGRVVIDIGCGSRPAIDFFADSVRYYIEPCIDKFIHIPQTQDAWTPATMAHTIGIDAETEIKWLRNTASFINCWNVLDHCYDWRAVFANMTAYARTGCIVSFGTDLFAHTGHPGIDAPDELIGMLHESYIILKEESGYWGRNIAMLLERK